MNTSSIDNDAPQQQTNSREHFDRMLSEMISYPERQAEIVKLIESAFGQQRAVMVLDMSGFSRTTQQHGIITFLLMIHQMQKICRPCVQQNGGIVAKADADNLFCLFDQVRDAVYASREIINRLEVVNMVLPVEKQLYVAFGIGFGSILNLANEDIFGDEMNLACKLGEDIAGKGEILLTSAAKAELAQSAQSDGSEIATREEVISISGISLVYYYVEGSK